MLLTYTQARVWEEVGDRYTPHLKIATNNAMCLCVEAIHISWLYGMHIHTYKYVLPKRDGNHFKNHPKLHCKIMHFPQASAMH